MQFMVGDREASIRSTCMSLHALVRLPAAIRAYNDKINRGRQHLTARTTTPYWSWLASKQPIALCFPRPG